MLKRCVRAEWLKLRRSYLWIVLIALPFLSILIGCANYSFNRSVLTNGWYSLWTQVSLFYGEFFLPVLISICCAYLCRLEHMNRNWNTVMTAPVGASDIFISKLVVSGVLILFVQLLFLALCLCSGKLLGMPQKLPPEIIGWISRGWFASITICTVQLLLSIGIRSFAVPIGICICAALAGIGAYVAKLGMYFPYSYLTIGMGVLSQKGMKGNENIMFFIMNIFFIIMFSSLAIYRLRRTDVRA